MEKIMAVYDVEPRYADRFADFTNQKERVPFEVVAFTTLETLKQYAKEHTIEILLISSAVPKEMVKGIEAGQVVVLSDGEVVPAPEDYPSVYKYQSTDSIIREVLAHYCEQPKAAGLVAIGEKAKLLGVYSPIGRCLKTSFAWTLAQQLGKDCKALFVSMEEFSGFFALTGEEPQTNLSDVFYFYRQGSCGFARLSSMVYTWGNIDYIPPVKYPEDLGQITGEELAEFLGRIAKESGYDVIVADMGNTGRQAIPVMELCEVVYMPVKDDCVSAAKLEEFENYLETTGKRDLLKKVKRLKLPYYSGFGRRDTYLEHLMWGELGDYVRQLLQGRS